MKFRKTPQFDRDLEKLPSHIQAEARRKFKVLQQNPTYPFHPSLRIKKMQKYKDIWEGHVTLDYVFTFVQLQDEETGETIFLFRRIGTHAIYDNP